MTSWTVCAFRNLHVCDSASKSSVVVTVWHIQEAPATLAENLCGFPQFLNSYGIVRSSNGPWPPPATYDHIWAYSHLIWCRTSALKKLSLNNEKTRKTSFHASSFMVLSIVNQSQCNQFVLLLLHYQMITNIKPS